MLEEGVRGWVNRSRFVVHGRTEEQRSTVMGGGGRE